MDKPLSMASLLILSETKDQSIGFGVAVTKGAAVGVGVEVEAGVGVSLWLLAQSIDPKQYANMRIIVKTHVKFFMVPYKDATTFYIKKSNWASVYTEHIRSFIFEASPKHYMVCSGKCRLTIFLSARQ
jgi:hypothetical protein